jgi:hypothetical protein
MQGLGTVGDALEGLLQGTLAVSLAPLSAVEISQVDQGRNKVRVEPESALKRRLRVGRATEPGVESGQVQVRLGPVGVDYL